MKDIFSVKVYPIEYLIKEELTEQDISNLLDNGKIGLTASLIVGMFKYIGSKKKTSHILKAISTDSSWIKKYTWKKRQRDEYEKLVIKVFKNIYQYKELQVVSLAQWFMIKYGLNVEGTKIDLAL